MVVVSKNNVFYDDKNLENVLHVSPDEAWKMICECEDCVVVDVRTDMEWENDGAMDLSEKGKEQIFLSWRFLPDMSINTEFLDSLLEKVEDKNSKILFLCKKGVRSIDAAAAANSAGYKKCYNIVGGYGDVNDDNDLKTPSCWIGCKLPVRGGK